MRKQRYLAYDFQMEDLSKLIFRKKGKLLVPAFEHGRILLKEAETNDGTIKRSELYLMQRPVNEMLMASQAAKRGFDECMLYASLGDMTIISKVDDNETAKFNIDVRPLERKKGYGTVLMNGGARYCRDIGIERLTGVLLEDSNIKKRVQFYKDLGMNAELDKESTTANVNESGLSAITFDVNSAAEEIWNSTKII